MTARVYDQFIEVLLYNEPSPRVYDQFIQVLRTTAPGVLEFPDSPTIGQTYSYTKYGTTETRKWEWNGVTWCNVGNSITKPQVSGSQQINFPSSPNLGDYYSINGLRWQWNGASWISALPI